MAPPGVLGRLGADVLALIGARAQLLAVEMQEARVRAELRLLFGALAAVFLALGLLLAALLVVVLFWDSHRLLAAAGVTAAFLGAGAWATARMLDIHRHSPPPFAATIEEFARDLRLLRGRHE